MLKIVFLATLYAVSLTNSVKIDTRFSMEIQPWEVMEGILKERIEKFHPRNRIAAMEEEKILRKEEIKKETIKVIISEKMPYVKIEENGRVTGYVGDLWSTLEEILQFSSSYEVIDNATVQRAALREGRGDIILNPVVPSVQDLDEFNHTIPIANTWYQMFVREESNNVSSRLYLSTWHEYLWYAFFTTLILLTLSLWIVFIIRAYYGLDKKLKKDNMKKKKDQLAWISGYKKTEKDTEDEKESDTTLGSCFLCCLASVTNQGITMKTKFDPARIVNIVCLFFGFLMYTSYSGVLVSKLTVTEPSVSFPTVESVAEWNTHALCVSENGFGYRNFKVRDDDDEILPQWKAVLNRKPCTAGYAKSDYMVPIEDYCNPGTVVLDTPYNKESTWGQNVNMCRISQLKGNYFYTSVSLLIRKGFPYTNLMNNVLLQLQSTGVATRIKDKWFPKKFHENSLEPDSPVTWLHIQEIFFLYCGVAIFSIFILGLELAIRNRQKIIHFRLRNTRRVKVFAH